ncbi:UDP-glucuronosyltransferase 2B17-like isoform X2 [Pseudomyrmex gracilis]|uniref:UDP-glucuronosyltransferase 2B17-like isoform X2 n=1 Tax=Pseudomyrmex gracilis TaxID=219809 RepID=UPI000995D3B4|nr:UDP-glucuronosyltransferase 2B17-like isoform X2 [Pseudomyrmex gracilis]
MTKIKTVTCYITCYLCIATSIEAARILAIIPIPSYSHQIPYRPIWTTLSQRGHEVVLLTTNPINNSSLTNLTEISFKHAYKLFQNFNIDFVNNLNDAYPWLETVRDHLWPMSRELIKIIYEHPQVREMYAPNSSEKFDLVIIETLKTPALYALAHRFNAPLIGGLSLGIYSHTHYLLGSPVLPSHPSTWEMEYDIGFNLSLWQRTKNFIRQWYHIYRVMQDFYPEQQTIAEKYLGKNIPNIADIERNMSLVLVNQQDTISFARPRTPNIILFGSFHVSSKLAPLSKDLEKFLANAPNGFVYVSLGTNVNMLSFPRHILNAFIDVFTKLPYKVVLKVNGEIANKSDNIYIAPWFPQQSLLGGLQSTEEAVHYAVPLVGIPILGDQYAQVFRMVYLGVAKYLNAMEISKELLNATIMEVISDKRYKERMLEIKALIKDKPYDLLENAIWWIEFVIRRKGASHLVNTIVYEPWHQRYDRDVIAVLSISTFIILICALIFIYKLVNVVRSFYSLELNIKKQKIN